MVGLFGFSGPHFKLTVIKPSNVQTSRSIMLISYDETGVVFVTDATIMYRYHVNHLSLLF